MVKDLLELCNDLSIAAPPTAHDRIEASRNRKGNEVDLVFAGDLVGELEKLRGSLIAFPWKGGRATGKMFQVGKGLGANSQRETVLILDEVKSDPRLDSFD